MAMRFRVVGCSPAWPNPGSAHSGYVVEASSRLLLDCGPGVLPRLREQNGRHWPDVDAIAITHFHLDHWGDLVPWVWGRMFGLGREREPVELWVPPGGGAELAGFGGRLGREDMFATAFALREYRDLEPFVAAGLQVTPVKVPHYTLDTYGFRVSDGSRTLAYSGDSAPSERLVVIARDADLFVCEATLKRGDLEGDLRGHLSADEAVDAFRRSGARRLLLTHRPNELPVEAGLELAYDGLVVDV